MKVVIFALALLLGVLYPITAHAANIEHQAGSVLVMDARSGEIIFHTEGYARRYPASVTKVMTALLVLERVSDLNEYMTFSETAVDIPDYASRVGITAGETITVMQALYGNLLPSGNEIARGLAEHVSGTAAEFVALMNQRAAQLGALNTNFVNPCGLPGDGQFTTAYDIALIMREAIRHPVFVDIISTAYFTIPPTNLHDEPRQLRNTNRMIRPDQEQYSPHVVGGKTGFTNAAQHTLVSYVRRDDRELIISVLYAPRLATFSDTALLMDYFL